MKTGFAYQIYCARHNKKWTIYELAKKIGKTPGYVSKIEGGAIPSPDMVIRLAEIFEIPCKFWLSVAIQEKVEEYVKNTQERYSGRKS